MSIPGRIAFIVAVVVFLVSVGMLVKHYMGDYSEQQDFSRLQIKLDRHMKYSTLNLTEQPYAERYVQRDKKQEGIFQPPPCSTVFICFAFSFLPEP